MSETSNQPSAAAALPPFYRNPMPVDATRHARMGVSDKINFGFARGTNAILLTGSEFAIAARTYPIAFSSGAQTVPFAIVGLRDNENLFVDAAGNWREDAYIPAYVRRYPFIFSEVPNSTQFLLCLDEAAECLEAESPQPFFVEGKPSASLQEILKFCEAFQAQNQDTIELGRWLEQHGLLEDRIARAELDGGQVFTMSGFRLVNVPKLRELSDAQVLELHKRGWLPLLHFHLQSLDNWRSLNRLMRNRLQQAA